MRQKLVLELQLVDTDQFGFLLHTMAFDGMAQGTRQGTALNLTLDKVVLRALLHGLGG
ncbi:MAG: hypothetical protein WDM77_11520 [Steroidobacteraceae bacterium]